MTGTPLAILTAGVGALTVLAFVWDVRTGRLPNWLTVPALAAGLLFHAIEGLLHAGPGGALGGLLLALGGFATGFGILWVLWLMGGSGGGDVKFMAALGSWLGATATFQVLVLSAVFAGLCSLGLLAADLLGVNPFQRQPREPKERSAKGRQSTPLPLRAHWFGGRGKVPFAVPATLATWCVLALQWAEYRFPWPQ
jgi:prepilin peptidase CpaA